MRVENLRHHLDKLDTQLLNVLARRMQISKQIGNYKRANNIPPPDKSRWNKVVKSRLKIANELNLDQQGVKEMLKIIHTMSLKQQQL